MPAAVQKAASPAKAESPTNNSSLMSAIRNAFFPFQGVARAPPNPPRSAGSSGQGRALPRILSSPEVRKYSSPRSGQFAGASMGSPEFTGALCSSRAHSRSTTGASLSTLRITDPHQRSSTPAGATDSLNPRLNRVGSNQSSPTVGSATDTSVPSTRANTYAHTVSHARSGSYGSTILSEAKAPAVYHAEDGSEDSSCISAMQYVAITLPALHQQVAAIDACLQRQAQSSAVIAGLVERSGQRSASLGRLQRLQAAIREVRSSADSSM
jgi:hypothetical protein